MITTLLLGLAMTGSDRCLTADRHEGPAGCDWVEAFGVQDPERDIVWAWFGEDQRFAILWSGPVRHVADRDTPLSPRDAAGRSLRACRAHRFESVEITSGMPDRDFAMAVAASAIRERPARMTPADAMVSRGLASGSYVTREAAHAVLARMGEAAIGACVSGLESADLEVRTRCGLILEEIRLGTSE